MDEDVVTKVGAVLCCRELEKQLGSSEWYEYDGPLAVNEEGSLMLVHYEPTCDGWGCVENTVGRVVPVKFCPFCGASWRPSSKL